jgi:hypothetical protein
MQSQHSCIDYAILTGIGKMVPLWDILSFRNKLAELTFCCELGRPITSRLSLRFRAEKIIIVSCTELHRIQPDFHNKHNQNTAFIKG